MRINWPVKCFESAQKEEVPEIEKDTREWSYHLDRQEDSPRDERHPSYSSGYFCITEIGGKIQMATESYNEG